MVDTSSRLFRDAQKDKLFKQEQSLGFRVVSSDRLKTALRVWLFLLPFLTIGHTLELLTVSTSLDQSGNLKQRYSDQLTPLTCHILAAWNILCGIIRVVCATNLENRQLFTVTLWTFIIHLVFLLSEILIYTGLSWTRPVITPLALSGFTSLWMSVHLFFLS